MTPRPVGRGFRKIFGESVGLKYSDKQQDYQSEIDEFDELMKKEGIYE